MNIRNLSSQKYLRLLGDVGQGPVIVSLRGENTAVSKVAPILSGEFRVVSFAVGVSPPAGEIANEIAGALAGLGVAQAAMVAGSATAIAALEFALSHPHIVQSLALLAPPALTVEFAKHLLELKTPVQALFGTRDAMRAPDAARKLCRAIPNCSLMYVFDADRAPDDERPEAVAAALKEFALKRERFLVTGKSGRLFA
jgi:pimeloyl-ACP methyl ester carboxylesterase